MRKNRDNNQSSHVETKMDTCKQKLTRLQNDVFRLLCVKAGGVLNQREIAKGLHVSPTAVAKSLPALEKEGLLTMTKDKKMNLVNVELNRENPKAIAFKRIENLKMICETDFVASIEERFPSCAIILFGSYSKGEDTKKSDIDIAIIRSKRKTIDLAPYEKMLERKIYLHCYEHFDMDKNLKTNIINGLTLSGMVGP